MDIRSQLTQGREATQNIAAIAVEQHAAAASALC